jgi:uncharacterized membrane-anchored protein
MLRTGSACLAFAVLAIAVIAMPVFAQEPPPPPAPAASASDAVPANPSSQPADSSAPSGQAQIAAAPDPEREARRRAAIEAFEKKLVRRTGKIDLPTAQVTLNVPESFYYLDAKDAEAVLVDAWGNPPGHPPLGMLFQKDASPLDGRSYGVVIRFEETGYVSDLDATKINYDTLLKQMRDDQQSQNIERAKNKFEQITIVGWATPPRYERQTHKLYWAQDLKFGAEPEDTLNYDIRVLGRKGVLSMNFVAGMSDVKAIETASPVVLAIPEFNAGSRYEDFNASTDTKSKLGLTGLILGGAVGGAVLAKKAGLIGIVLLALKKLWVVVIAAFAGVGGAIKRFFGGDKAKPKAGAKASALATRSADSIFDPLPPATPAPSAPDADPQSTAPSARSAVPDSDPSV